MAKAREKHVRFADDRCTEEKNDHNCEERNKKRAERKAKKKAKSEQDWAKAEAVFLTLKSVSKWNRIERTIRADRIVGVLIDGLLNSIDPDNDNATRQQRCRSLDQVYRRNGRDIKRIVLKSLLPLWAVLAEYHTFASEFAAELPATCISSSSADEEED